MTMTEHKSVNTNRLTSEMFARVFQAFKECSDEIQLAIADMVEVFNSDDATEDEREAAISTITEALFPSRDEGELGINLEKCASAVVTKDAKEVLRQMNEEEATFATRLQELLDLNNMTQGDLAKKIDVGQSAISMMLTRDCRPQRRTVEKIAQALKVSVEDLWP